jgi:N-acyl-D-amino-acid deacylase
MTSASADRFGLKDRGILSPKKAADVVVFNPEIISETPPLGKKPAGSPRGIEYVFINGVQVVSEGSYINGNRAGQVLRL